MSVTPFKRGPAPPLIGLDSLKLELPPLVVEGEPSVAVGREWWPHRPVLTWEGGEWGAEASDWTPLAGRPVTLFPRNDDMGTAVMETISDQLRHLGCRVTLVELNGSDLPFGYDLAAAKEAGIDKGVVIAFAQTHCRILEPFAVQQKKPTSPEAPGAAISPPPATMPLPKGANSAAPSADSENEAFEAVPLEEISDEVRPQVVQNIFDAGSVGVMAGSPNAGKTFLAVHLAVHVAAGEAWFGAKVAQGPVVYVAAEAPGSVKTRARLAAARHFEGRRLPFYVVSASPGLGDEAYSPHDTDKLCRTLGNVASIEGSECRMLIIDTVASVLGGGEENADGMLRLAASAKFIAAKTNVCVVLVHHPSKADPTSLRGHSSLAAAVDAILVIETDEGTGIRTATLTKSRDSAAGKQIFFELESVTLPGVDYFGDVRTSCIVRGKDVPESKRRRPGGKAQEAMLIELERRYRDGEHAWDRATIITAAKGLGQHRNTASMALLGLIKGGFVSGSDASLSLRHPPED